MEPKNTFADSFEPDEATVLALRSDLARILRAFLRHSGSQTVVARQLGVQQSLVSKICRGDIANLSLEKLVKLCVRARVPAVAQWGLSPHTAEVRNGNPFVDEAIVDESNMEQNASYEIDVSSLKCIPVLSLRSDSGDAMETSMPTQRRTRTDG